jgi:hypothetical protein
MFSPRRTKRLALLTPLAALAFAALTVPALAEDEVPTYEVTITNLTYDQIISPPVVVLHDGRFRLFAAGQPAGPELAPLAEDGATGPLVGLLGVSDGVAGYAVASGGILPGGSITVEVSGSASARRISAVGMLVSTNDAFFGVAGAAVPNGRSGVTLVDAPAYDAGSEANTESCVHIPGPPCGSGGVRVTDGAEGFVHVHRGVHGNGDLDAAGKDWRNPAARVTVRRVDR